MLNKAFNDDSGSWWWWINIIGTLVFGLIGNLICFFVVCRYSFVIYLRALSLFDFLTLIYEFVQSLNDLFLYSFSLNLLNFRKSIICKFSSYSSYSIILVSCWTIVALTIDRFLVVCDPFSRKCQNFSRRIWNSNSAKRIILILIILSLLINIPQFISKEWICRPTGFQYSAVYNEKFHLNQTKKMLNKQICSCRVSPLIKSNKISFYIFWNNSIFHFLSYTLIPAIILITCNKAILKCLHAPRRIVSNQNEYLRSKLTNPLTLVSIIFLVLYFPYAIVETLSYIILRHSQSHCNINLILKRLTELLNICALGINFFFLYIIY